MAATFFAVTFSLFLGHSVADSEFPKAAAYCEGTFKAEAMFEGKSFFTQANEKMSCAGVYNQMGGEENDGAGMIDMSGANAIKTFKDKCCEKFKFAKAAAYCGGTFKAEAMFEGKSFFTQANEKMSCEGVYNQMGGEENDGAGMIDMSGANAIKTFKDKCCEKFPKAAAYCEGTFKAEAMFEGKSFFTQANEKMSCEGVYNQMGGEENDGAGMIDMSGANAIKTFKGKCCEKFPKAAAYCGGTFKAEAMFEGKSFFTQANEKMSCEGVYNQMGGEEQDGAGMIDMSGANAIKTFKDKCCGDQATAHTEL